MMTKKLDLVSILTLLWLLLHRFVLEWYKRLLGLG
jgi:hypothetical protein